MADFITTRNDLFNNRTSYSVNKQQLSASNDRLRRYTSELQTLTRQQSDNDPAFIRQRRTLEEKISSEKETNTRLKATLESDAATLKDIEGHFSLFIDPRRELNAHFDNNTPFLLFPLRIETRFKTTGNQPQLWVRVFPDDCLVDSFEALLSRKEVNNGARFWAEYYSAGQPADPDNPDAATLELQRSAWRLLVSAHGDGRSAWIVKQLIPDAGSIFPQRGVNTIILTILTPAWDLSKQAIITELFKKLWFADKNQLLITQIKSDFDLANPGMNADEIIDNFQPVNFDDKLPAGLKREDADLRFAIVIFKDLDIITGKQHSWSQPTTVNLMPERLALILTHRGKQKEPIFGKPIPFPLHTSPDPSVDAKDQFKQTDDHDLEFGDDIRWVADFDRAVEIGMGFRVNLEAEEARGFSSLMILGVRLSSDDQNGKLELQNLFDHHFYSKKGFALIPQGTPTNNTEAADSGYGSIDMPDKTFDLYLKNKAAYAKTDDFSIRQDGQWFANWLGIDDNFTQKLLYADGYDQADARNMNTALWPGTLGYVMSSLMKGGFSNEVVDSTREFFNTFVSGRGPVPAIRIGNQPYGILPTTAFNRLTWIKSNDRLLARNTELRFVNRLYDLLIRLENFWNNNFLNTVPHISEQSGTPYQTLLDVIKLHPNSVEFYRRYMETLIEMSNAMSLMTTNFLQRPKVVEDTMTFLRNTLGYPTEILPQLAALLGLPWQVLINTLIDDSPISESKGIRSYTTDKRNYIAALVDEARKSENAIRTGEGLSERPSAELYRLLKYALEQEYHNSGIKAADSVAAFPAAQLAAMQVEKPFTHQLLKGEVTESRYSLLYQTIPAISPTKTVAEFVRDSLVTAIVPPHSKYLATQINAIDKLKEASTARLERALVEHIDCLSYRLDAWKTAIVTYGLSLMRKSSAEGNNQQQKPGIFLGAYGWVLNVVPESGKVLTQKELPEDLRKDFNANGKRTYVTDPTNEGYIHAPSLNQAVTAAVLRNGYISHGKPDGNNVLAVNLSSDRVRVALSVIEGIQGGQSLAALLGYHLERELHDRSDLTAKK